MKRKTEKRKVKGHLLKHNRKEENNGRVLIVCGGYIKQRKAHKLRPGAGKRTHMRRYCINRRHPDLKLILRADLLIVAPLIADLADPPSTHPPCSRSGS
ncbi:hypothetical protein J6590_027336 [Homalodisca vitripennis]|nr:hypothetical protein J6590_027336 [Homalodisca vitripennis]